MAEVAIIEEKLKSLTRRDRSYKLQYRYKSRFGASQGRVNELAFWFDGDLKSAVARARIHCEKMDYQFIYCSPDILDLDAREASKAKGELDESEG